MDAVAAIGEAMAGEQGMGGWESSAGGADAYDASNTGKYGMQAPMGNVSIADAIASVLGLGQPAKQTGTFPTGQSMAPKTSSPFSLASFTPVRFGASLLAAMTGNQTPRGIMTTDTHNLMQQNQFMQQDPSLYSEFPATKSPMDEGRRGLISAALAGSGPQQGLASAVETIGGMPVNVGPTLIMDPGEVNPMNRMMFQGGAEDPYVRKPRNIAQMVGVQ